MPSGKVKWFNSKKGYGFVTDEDTKKDIFLHVSALEESNLKTLKEAQMLEFDIKEAPPENPMSADRVKWEHIHRVFELCNRNVSETARRLKMHRRTLQRILSKRSPR